MTIMIKKRPAGRRSFKFKRVNLRVINENEKQQWSELMDEYHPLGGPNLPGAQLRYVIEHCGIALGLMSFSASSYHLADRDRFIGWNRRQMQARRNFVVQNSRFLIFPWVNHTNLASRALGLAAKSLEKDWKEAYGYAPVLVETFVDPQFYEGTCYRAAGWEMIGHTRGFRRDKDNFYQKDSTPKTIWIKKLRNDAVDLLSSDILPEELRAFESQVPKKLNLEKVSTQNLSSLFTILNSVPDNRKGQGKKYPVGFCLAVVVCAVMAGSKSLREAEEFAKSLSQPQLRALRCWKDTKTKKFTTPNHVTLWRIIAGVDADILELKVQEWINGDQKLPSAIAIDGKALRATLKNEDGAVFATSAIAHSLEDLFF